MEKAVYDASLGRGASQAHNTGTSSSGESSWKENAALFQELNDELCASLEQSAIRQTYSNGENIYLQEDEAEFLYIIESGHVRLSHLREDGSTFLYAIITAGQSFGELGVFQRSVHADTACALGDVVVHKIRRSAFHVINEQSAEICRALAVVVAKHYRSYIESTRCLSLPSLSARLAHALLSLLESIGTPAGSDPRDKSVISGAIVTQSDLGAMARGTRSNINRRLKEWERAGIIKIQDRSITVLNRTMLERNLLNNESNF
ncbi:Crp/Fnr family transcriptional regulator [Pseudovibrio sp. JE062]|uniref:Crp/Fnr family transcriptional regulator n=1 Tax=Pseudovibrio sp. JE062 TaxID=439495 RepID=UPI000186C12E|nr:Crp/Fnr family transcriptional regulator [Pseudovibrio sp. JE062]EEA96820.1 cyclic nucleotide-binding domain protein [Pseudovibrio sp. JE062]